MKLISLITAAVLPFSLTVQAQTERPTMGWSSWNTYRVNISDSLIMQQADACVSQGLNEVGYTYINIDDGYFGGRDKNTGRLLIHPMRFPKGLKPVVDHIHGLGLKAGIYSDAGANTCGCKYDNDTIARGVGLYGHDQQDADMFFKELGFDFIKIDFCGGSSTGNTDYLALDPKERYTAIRQAIINTGRNDVRMNVCRWDYPGTWVNSVAQSWRMSHDISARWSSVKDIIQQNLYLSAYAKDGHYNDMDMLEVGRTLTAEEDRTHFGMWCIMSSPLLIGCDMTKLKPETLELLKNQELIALNQDVLGLQAYVAKHDQNIGTYVLVKDILQTHGLTRAVALYNPTDVPTSISINFADLELGGQVKVRDVFARADVKLSKDALGLYEMVPAHGCRIYTLTASKRLPRKIYEAETAWLSAYQELYNAKAVGTAYYEKDSLCSGGMKVTNLGYRPDNDLQWQDVYTEKDGVYQIRIKCLSFAEKSQLYIAANDGVGQQLMSNDCVEGTVSVKLFLHKGLNTIRLYNDHGPMPEIDYMIVDDSPVTFGKLTVEGRVQPLGLDDLHPRFGWQLMSGENDVRQISYHLQVSSTPDGQGDVWDSSVVRSDSSQWVSYKGPTLLSNKEYFWRVKVTTNKGASEWSNTALWSTGLLSSENWKGQWIGLDSITSDVVMERHSRIAVRHLQKDFQVRKPVKRATVHVCGLGYYIMKINNQRIGDYLLCPAPTQYDKAVIYDTYDVTRYFQLSMVKNKIDIILAGGYFFPPTQNYQTNVRSAYGMPKLRMNLIVEYEDGSNETIATDSTWQITIDGPIRYANLYDGTLVDYNRQPTEWMPVQIVEAPCGKLRGNSVGGVKSYATEGYATINTIGRNRYIIDFGTNNTGRVFLPAVTIEKGDTISIRYAETLKADGELYTDNLRAAQNTDYFVGNGKEVDLTTEFIWHGFRYMEVLGLKEADVHRITRQLMTDDLLTTATIDIQEGDGMINKILDNARRGILSNYKGIPMDCPQRDERMPWLGDRTMGCYGESYLTYNHTLYAKWLTDISDAQREDGNISDVCPAYWRLYNGNITWPAALPFGMEMLRLQYGDERPMREHADNVKRFLAFAKKKSGNDGLITYDRYGDWCVPPASLDEVLTKDSTRLTNGTLISSCYYYHICKMMGMDDEAAVTCDAINRTFLKDNCYDNGTVTANLLPLALDIVPVNLQTAVQQRFMQKVKGSSGEAHIDCGVIGISWLMRYLSKAGLGDVAYKIASTVTYPGWGYMVEKGATTIWELWNGNTADPSMNSGNHVMMLGDFIPWVYECLAGIAPDSECPGFKHIIMRPDFSISALNGATATYPSIYGEIRSSWKRKSDIVIWDITIPANTTATVWLPNGKKENIGSGVYNYHVKVDK